MAPARALRAGRTRYAMGYPTRWRRMSAAVLQIQALGLGVSVQDHGRVGWRRFGVPLGGVMDAHAATWANRLLNNPSGAALLEFLLQGARICFLRETWVALSGADASCGFPLWRAMRMRHGDIMEFPRHRTGVWTYLAVQGGLAIRPRLGSRSTYAPACLGQILKPGDIMDGEPAPAFDLPHSVASRLAPALEQRDYARPPAFRVWPAPQTESFSAEALASFFSSEWTVSSQSNRVGYRLTGRALSSALLPWSEPVRVGAIQVPENGQPIVMMRDAPTIGGYPKLGTVDAADLSWLAQCCPGQHVRFVPVGAWPALE
ncbi:MAG TPA: biotin-dependent carboxyltransferase family protein [Verrucomicrobiae bacterium]|nr:biotin-dependent carboxyltransferase family protein [Verrucomicrobiae bacterium]